MQNKCFRKSCLIGIILLFVGASVLPCIKSDSITMKNERSTVIVSDFESGLEGWSAIGDGSVVWYANGGNPGGFAYYTESGSGGHAWAVAPWKFFGDWSKNIFVQVDIKVFQTDITEPFEFWISGPGGSAKYYSGIYPTLNWQTIQAPIQQSLWTMESGSWLGLISDVTEFMVDVEFGTWYDETGIDNVILSVVENQLPATPTINGSTSGKPGSSYPYIFTSIDPDGDEVSYFIEWGDGDVTTWTEFRPSGSPGYSESHWWDTKGEYIIHAKAKDVNGGESDWAELTVIITKTKSREIIPSPLLVILERMMEQIPYRFLILQHIMGL
jgi:hypothetical protein